MGITHRPTSEVRHNLRVAVFVILVVNIAACVSREPIINSVKPLNGLIAYTLRDSSGKLQIFTARADGASRRQLTFGGDNGRPDWSPDGTRIVFCTRRGRRVFTAVMDADGSNLTILTEGNGPDWSPDGRQIAFSKGGEIWLIEPDGSNLTQITTGQTQKAGPSWSPDGNQMAFILMTHVDSGDPIPEIGIMNSDGTRERILTTEDRLNTRTERNGTVTVLEKAHAANAPAWSPVDNRIAFWSGIRRTYGQVWVMEADGSKSTQLTEDPTHRNSDDPSWSPDGSRVLFSTGRSGRNELWVMDADGLNERRLFNIDAGPFPGRASWQPMVYLHESSDKSDAGEGR